VRRKQGRRWFGLFGDRCPVEAEGKRFVLTDSQRLDLSSHADEGNGPRRALVLASRGGSDDGDRLEGPLVVLGLHEFDQVFHGSRRWCRAHFVKRPDSVADDDAIFEEHGVPLFTNLVKIIS
jgi:hypothetical protein